MNEIEEVKSTFEKGGSSSTTAAEVPIGAQIRDIENDHTDFSFTELEVATGNFRRRQRIKKGSTADIFKGRLDNKAIAVKRLKSPLANRDVDYLREFDIRYRVRHPNIIKLIGSCSHEHERILVYELPLDNLDTFTLHDHLKGRGHQLLSWQRRMNIAAGISKVLRYLHSEDGPRVSCSDLNTNCVILDSNFEGKLLDIGTNEFQLDIYRFGLLLYEIVTGKKARNYSLRHCNSSVETRVKKILDNEHDIDVVDRKLGQQFSSYKLHRALSLVLYCLHLHFHVDVSPDHYKTVERAMQYLISANPTEPWPINTSPSYNHGLSLNNIQEACNPRVLSIKEIREAIQNLPKEENFQKGFVTNGKLNGQLVAIKWLSSRITSIYEIDVELLSRLSHPNIIKLIGFCDEEMEKILVYEFMPNYSLRDQFQEKKSMTWDKRMKIANDVAKALEYLHYKVPPVIYGDLKPSNILLDESFNAKLSDFGSAKSSLGKKDSPCPYWAPERRSSGHLSVKSDVFNFGVILHEMLFGDCTGLNKLKDTSEYNLSIAVKSYLQEDIDSDTILKAIKVVSTCVSELNLRPNMRNVVRAMDHLTYDPRIAKGQPPEWPQEFI